MKNNEKDISVIAVEGKDDVIKAGEILKKCGIYLWSTESQRAFLRNGNYVSNDFLVLGRDHQDWGWRLQSYHLSQGVAVDQLEDLIKSGEAQLHGKQINIKNHNNKTMNKTERTRRTLREITENIVALRKATGQLTTGVRELNLRLYGRSGPASEDMKSEEKHAGLLSQLDEATQDCHNNLRELQSELRVLYEAFGDIKANETSED